MLSRRMNGLISFKCLKTRSMVVGLHRETGVGLDPRPALDMMPEKYQGPSFLPWGWNGSHLQNFRAREAAVAGLGVQTWAEWPQGVLGAVTKELIEQDKAPSLSGSESVHVCWPGQLGEVAADVAADMPPAAVGAVGVDVSWDAAAVGAAGREPGGRAGRCLRGRTWNGPALADAFAS